MADASVFSRVSLAVGWVLGLEKDLKMSDCSFLRGGGLEAGFEEVGLDCEDCDSDLD